MNRDRAPQTQSNSNTRMPQQYGVNGKWSSGSKSLPHPMVCLVTVFALLLLQYAVLSIITLIPDPNTENSRNLEVWNNIDKGKVQTSYTDAVDDLITNQRSIDFKEGSLNVHPTLHRQCVTIRFRGDENNYTVDDAISLLVKKYIASPGPRQLRMGISIMEDVDLFLPVRIRSSGNQYHMFHFTEMLVLAYISLHRLSSTLPIHSGYNVWSQKPYNYTPTSLAKGSPSITVPWIFSPYMSPLEICGGASKINCLVSDLILQGSNRSIFSSRSGIIGLNAIEKYPFDYQNEKMKAISHRIELAKYVYGEAPTFADSADGVILVERFGCHMGGINKPWSSYIDMFPAYSWHSDLLYGLGRTWEDHKSLHPKRFVLGYIDRQNTDRRLPNEHHDWIVEYATQHVNIEFRQLYMETYTAVEQVKKASECDMLIGVHGNGLTHALWMQPQRYVIEVFWKYNYQFDYATIAHMMKHSYLGILNGKVVDATRVENRDPSLRKSPTRKEAQHASVNESMYYFEHEAKAAIQGFIEEAMDELI